jgi:hypothetical protein
VRDTPANTEPSPGRVPRRASRPLVAVVRCERYLLPHQRLNLRQCQRHRDHLRWLSGEEVGKRLVLQGWPVSSLRLGSPAWAAREWHSGAYAAGFPVAIPAVYGSTSPWRTKVTVSHPLLTLTAATRHPARNHERA